MKRNQSPQPQTARARVKTACPICGTSLLGTSTLIVFGAGRVHTDCELIARELAAGYPGRHRR